MMLVRILYLHADVIVSVPAMLTVGEEDEMVQVCVTLSVVEDTERDLNMTLTTSDGIGIDNQIIH